MAPPRLKLYLKELRAPFLIASGLAVALGAAVAYCCTGLYNLPLFLVSLAGVAFIHAGSNVANDYFDKISGCDDLNSDYRRPFTGGSRLIQEGLLTPREVITESLVLYTLGAICGIYLSLVVGWWALIIGAVGAISGFCYSAPPLQLASRGLGEPVVAVDFGVLVTLGSYYVQTGRLAWAPVIASMPLAFLIASVLYINQFQDASADAKSGKRHWVVRLGRKRAAILFPAIMILPYIATAASVFFELMPVWTLIAMAALPLSVLATFFTLKYYTDSKRLVPANALTAAAHAAFAVFLITAYLLET